MVAKSVKLVSSFLNSSALTRPLMVLGAVSAAWSGASAQSVDPNTLPQGANVVGGNATVQQAGNALNINQSSNRTVIDWRSFDIGSSAQVNFNQPGTSSIAVNRVNNSANPTQIQGGLHANGQVWILNPNGVYFGSTARVDAAGVVATTANIDVKQFMAGSNRLQMTGSDHGSVTNAGSITVGESGLAAFVAPSVRNSGTINARVGKVTLAAGTTYTLDLAGDRLVEIGLGSVNAVVDQSGKIVNPGGTVALTAKAAGQVVNSVVNVSGVVDASSVKQVGGKIVLGGDDITTTSSAVLAANGGSEGNGGAITAVADRQGIYAGTFSAKGGATSGDGGKIETSGKALHIDNAMAVDTSAPKGTSGNWTLDPDTLTVGNSGGAGTISSGLNSEDATIDAGTVVTALNTTNVTLQAKNAITIDTAIDASLNTNAHNLSLNDQDLNGLTVNLNDKITLKTGGLLSGQGTTVNVANGASIQNGIDAALAGAAINVGAGSYNIGRSIALNKAGLRINGVVGAVLNVSSGVDGAFTIGANNVTVQHLEFAGPYTANYSTTNWNVDHPNTTAVVVGSNFTGFTISDNSVHDMRTGIRIHGAGNSGSVTANTIENTKGGVIVQYTGGAGITVSDNKEGTFGNEWGMAFNTNSPGPNSGTAPTARQAELLALSRQNGGWAIQDRLYASANRTKVVVDASSKATAADDFGYGNALGNPRQPLTSIQAGINAVVSGGTVNVNNGTYAANSGYISINKSLKLIGQSETGVIIDARNASSYGIRTIGGTDGVTLSNFTLWGVAAAGGYGIKAEDTTNLSIDHVTSKGAYKAQFDLNGVRTGRLNFVTADGTSNGVGSGSTKGAAIAITDGQDILLENSSTNNGSYGGVGIYQSNKAGGYSYQAKNITIASSNTFGEANPVYMEDESATNNFGTVTVNGFGYIGGLDTNPADTFKFFQTSAQNAIDYLDAIGAVKLGYVEGWVGTAVDNLFTVAASTGHHSMAINPALSAAASGATISVGAGTYAETLNITKNVDIVGAGVGQTIIQPTTLLATGVNHKYDTNVKATVFVHDASNVNLRGMTIDGANLGNNAVVFWNNASGSIQDSLILNPMTFSGVQTGQGLAVDSTAGHTTTLNVSNVMFGNWNKNAIDVVTGDGATSGGGNVSLTVEKSTFTGRGANGTNAQNAIVLWERGGGTVNATIDDSRFTDLSYTDPTKATAAGVLVYGSPRGTTTVSNSSFTDIQEYISTAGGATHEINATQGNTFDGVAASSATLDQLFAIEDHVVDGTDESGNGLVRFVAGQVYVTAAKGSIQKGVNAASSGDTVNVQAGTYSGFGTSFGGSANLTIQTSQGAVIDASSVPVNPVTRVVDLRADSTTLKGFTIKGNGNDVGISISGKGVTASGNTISGVLTGVQTTTQYPANNATITGNIITARYGVSLQSAGATVSGNTVTASTEGVGLKLAANTTFSNNTFTVGASGRAVNFVDAMSSGGLTASGNTVNVAGGDLQGAVYLAGTNGALNLAAGNYSLVSTLLLSKNGLTLKGVGEGVTTLTSTAGGYGINVTANNVTLSSFSYNGNPSGSYSVKVSPSGTGSSRLLAFAIDHVAINGSKRTGLDLNGVNGATIDHVTVTNSAAGNGITLTDSANVTITNASTSGNAWGGLALYQDNSYYDQQETDITVDASNNFAEVNGVYLQDSSNGTTKFGGASGLDFGTVNIAGYSYAVLNPNGRTKGDGAQFVWLQKDKQSAIDFAMGTFGLANTSSSFVKGWTGGGTSNIYTVGVSTGGQAMSINAAVNASISGTVIDVLDGTYAEAVTVSGARTLNLGTVTVDSLTLDTGAAGTQISGKLSGGSIALNGAVTLSGDLTLDTSANNGAIVVAAVDGTAAGMQALTLKAGTGTVSLGDVGATTALGAVSDAAKTTMTGSTYAANSLDLGALTLTKDTTLNAGTIMLASVDGTTAGAQALTLKGGPVSLGDVGTTTRLGTVSDAGATTLTGSTYAADSFDFGTLILTNDTAFDAGSVSIASVDGTTAGAQALTLKTATVSLGDVGATTRLGAVSDANATTLTGSTYAANSLAFGAVTLTKDTVLNAGKVTVASVDGTTAGVQALTLKASTVSLGNLGATTRLAVVSDAAATTLTGSAYTAKAFAFSGPVTLTAATTTLDTAGGNIVFTGDIFGTANGGQSLVLNAGSGLALAAAANGNITMQNAGTRTVRLNNLTVNGNSFTALTVALAGNFVSHLTGDQVFAADTLDTLGSVNSTVAGNASGHIAASGAVTLGVTGNLSGTISGGAITLTTGTLTNSTITGTGSLVVGAQSVTGAVLNAPTVTVTAGSFDGTVNATNTASIQAATIGGTFTAGTVTLAATDTVTANVTANTLNMSAAKGDVNGTWTTVNTTGAGTLVINGESNLGNSGANPNQLVVEGFALPLGTQLRPSGEIVLPQGLVLGLLSPGGASSPRVIVVHDVRRLGELLEAGYVAIIMDLSGREKDKETRLASN